MTLQKIKSANFNQSLLDEEGEVRELTIEDIKLFEPADKFFNKAGRPKSLTVKTHLNIRLDEPIVEHLRASGKGWQTRLNAYIARGVACGDL